MSVEQEAGLALDCSIFTQLKSRRNKGTGEASTEAFVGHQQGRSGSNAKPARELAF